MNRQKWLILVVALALMAGTAGLLGQLRAHQRLAPPGVKTHPLPDSNRLQVDLPERVLDYDSKWQDPDEVTLGTLPADTSFGQRIYTAPDGFMLACSVVLMGADRTSLHKPQFCLEGSGFNIDQGATRNEQIHIQRGHDSFELPVVALFSTKEEVIDGRSQPVRGIYVYWYVADDAMSAGALGFERMYMMAKRMLRTGALQRWAYVSYLAQCLPGQEEATLDRMKKFIAASVPQFQTTPRAAGAAGIAASQ